MGCCASAFHSGSYLTREGGGSPNVPADADGASPESQPRPEVPAPADPVATKQHAKPDAAVAGAVDPGVQGKGAVEDVKPQEPCSPTKAQAEPTTPTGDAAKQSGHSLSKKPSVIGTAKEDVLGVLESMKKNVEAAKEAFFERPSKAEQTKPPSSPTKPAPPVDEKRTEQAEPAKTPEAKKEGFFAKLGFTKPEEQHDKHKVKEEAVPKSPGDGKKSSGIFHFEFKKQASAEGPSEPPKNAAATVSVKTPPAVLSTADAIKQSSQEWMAAGAAQAEALKKASEEAVEAGKGKASEVVDAGKQKTQELVNVGKAGVEDVKQKTQVAADSVKSTAVAVGDQANKAADAAAQKAGELKEAALKAADAAKEQAASLAQHAQQSAAAAAGYMERKGDEAVQYGKAQADVLAQKSQEAASAAKSKVEELKESTVSAGKDAAAATAAKAEAAKNAAEQTVASGVAHVASATEKAKQTLESEAEKVGLAFQQAKPAVLEASESVKEAAHETTDAAKSGAESLKEQSQKAEGVAHEAPKSAFESAASAVKAVPEFLGEVVHEGKEKIESLFAHEKQEEPARTPSPMKEMASNVLAAGMAQFESLGHQVKSFLSDEPEQPEEETGGSRPLDVHTPKESVRSPLDAKATVGGERPVASKTVTIQEKSYERAESPKARSQEALDSAKSEAELLVEQVISSVVGASESLKHSENDAAHSEKDRIEQLKEKAQHEFALCQEKAHQLFSDVSSAVSGAATTVAAKSAEIYDATKSKAHAVSEQVSAAASETTESLKHGMHVLHDQAGMLLHTSKPEATGEAPGDCAAGFPGKQCEEPKEASLLQADTQQEKHGDRLSPSPKPEDIESAVVKIQAGVRGYLTRKNLNVRTHQDGDASTGNATHTEQVAAVGSISDPSDTEAAATKIQAAFRGYMVRKELKPDNGPSSAVNKEERELVESR
ncbi:uncharacterized protein LOC144136707 isoform X1 [Amblyomma americanum]